MRHTYSVADIAKRWGCSRDIVYMRIHGGALPSFRVGSRMIRVTAEALAANEAKPAVEPVTDDEAGRLDAISLSIKAQKIGRALAARRRALGRV